MKQYLIFVIFTILAQSRLEKIIYTTSLILSCWLSHHYFQNGWISLISALPTITVFLLDNWQMIKGHWNLQSYVNKSKAGLEEYNKEYPKFAENEIAKIQPKLEELDFLDYYKGKAFYHIGSTAILGMLGKSKIDLICVTKNLLPKIPQVFMKFMEEQGYVFSGVAPHSMNKYKDQWFMKQDEDHGYVIHFVSGKEAMAELQDFLNYRDYCNNNKDAFNRYRDAKKQADGDGKSLFEYKMNKSKIVLEIKKEANIWKQNQSTKKMK